MREHACVRVLQSQPPRDQISPACCCGRGIHALMHTRAHAWERPGRGRPGQVGPGLGRPVRVRPGRGGPGSLGSGGPGRAWIAALRARFVCGPPCKEPSINRPRGRTRDPRARDLRPHCAFRVQWCACSGREGWAAQGPRGVAGGTRSDVARTAVTTVLIRTVRARPIRFEQRSLQLSIRRPAEAVELSSDRLGGAAAWLPRTPLWPPDAD